ncbi:hypothetical protein [Litoreibacter arenae]|uniref:Uncharacterized protein n=1 Tax=Litoreibacter arenae DSM 19593 TaxID=1123360 RepID=S9QKE1_9RHOB|nr:hypothetical protein [Litoreibacter arenae]EPX80043.1 hypothetical protein thalar_01379 [Litoreibacter arenae DSM 19593]
MAQSPRWIRPVAIPAALFGVATIYSGGTALFGGAAAREAVGDAVPLVLWFNFLAGFAYILGAVAMFIRAPWARLVAWLIAASTLLVFAIFAVMALSGTPFEWRTVGAMVLRSGFWLAIALALSRAAQRNPQLR